MTDRKTPRQKDRQEVRIFGRSSAREKEGADEQKEKGQVN